MSNESSTIRLLVWDDPDMKASLASVLVSPPSKEPDADLEAVFLWLTERCQPGDEAEACLFTAIEPGNEAGAAQYVTDIRNQGFAVVVRPAAKASTAALSASVRAYVDRMLRDRVLSELVVASHDGEGLQSYLHELSGRGVAVTVLGFRERAQYAADSSSLGFVDVETVEGAFAFPLPRTNLYDLPEDGVALPPLRKPARDGARPTPPVAVQPAPTPERLSSTSPWSPEGTSDVIYPAPSYSPASSGTDYTPASALGDYTPSEQSSYYTPAAESSVEADPAGNPDEPGVASEPPPSPLTAGLFGNRSAGLLGDETGAVPSPPPPPSPPSVDALDDLLAGVQASPTPESEPPPSPLRPGRVSPPNGLPD
jgi:uncharacterized protein